MPADGLRARIAAADDRRYRRAGGGTVERWRPEPTDGADEAESSVSIVDPEPTDRTVRSRRPGDDLADGDADDPGRDRRPVPA